MKLARHCRVSCWTNGLAPARVRSDQLSPSAPACREVRLPLMATGNQQGDSCSVGKRRGGSPTTERRCNDFKTGEHESIATPHRLSKRSVWRAGVGITNFHLKRILNPVTKP